ncbi:MAG: hypothetical protein EOM61_04105 [Bacteroidia bacterium]|jgi:hypothetical protein|uniref:Uncharacterized protein n=1 Tax=bioreactor metagenome TaxID=1076179 RepID=A0A644ZII5_9ZZZZ|nr:hypothetical protein [Rikenellaceae bacterium]NCB18788.1 hypothetical protein [Bacteroidia bacterium]
MKAKFDIEDPVLKKHLRENSFNVPEGYFAELREILPSKIGTSANRSGNPGIWTVLKPQLGLVMAFALVFLAAYGVFGIFGKGDDLTRGGNGQISGINETIYIEEGFLKTTFIDFYDNETDSVTRQSNQISQDELIDYINENLDLVTLSYLEVRD